LNVAFSQKKVKLKQKQTLRALNYYKLPRVINNYKVCKLTFGDDIGSSYTTKGVDSEISMMYLKGFVTRAAGDYDISVKK